MKALNRALLKEELFNKGNLDIGTLEAYPDKVLQFGEGNFLRGFVDWMFNRLNKQGLFNGNVVVVQSIREGLVNLLNEQDGLYTLLLRGIQNGEVIQKTEVITSVSRGIDIYANFNQAVDLAESPDLRVIISNTTEAGIAYIPGCKFEDEPPESFPAKLAVLLYKRFIKFGGDNSKGLIILPCELIDRNGDSLKKIVLRLADEWQFGEDFIKWLEEANYFLNTLVDRIITGYPKDEINSITQELGYEDKLVDTSEIFYLWVIEGDKKLAEELPFDQAGLNVIWTNDITPYRLRKVHILNGAHTMTVLAAYLYGLNTVKDCMDDSLINAYMKKGIFEEIIPTLDLPEHELIQFSNDVLERFANPFIKHCLLSISLNSTSKFKARILPSLMGYIERKHELPKVLTFSIAALFAFYKGTEIRENSLIGVRNGIEYRINDDMRVLETFSALWKRFDNGASEINELVSGLLSQEAWWGMDLNCIDGLCNNVTEKLHDILYEGPEKAIKDLLAQ